MRMKSWSGLAATLVLVVGACGGVVERSGGGGGGSGATASGGTSTGGGSGSGATGGTTPAGPCDLSLVASGALPRRAQRTVDSVAVAASAKGFTIAYVEIEPGVALYDNALANLSASGQIGNVVQIDAPGCPGPAPSRGAAVSFDTTGSAGLAAFAVGNCGGGGAGAMFFRLSAGGSPASPKTARNPDASAITVGPHALAPLGVDRYAFAYPMTTSLASGAQLATLTGDQFDGTVTALFGALDADNAAIATSGSVRGILGHLTTGSELLEIGAPDADAGAGTQKQLGVQPWGAVAALGSRVAVVLPSAIGMQYRLFADSSKAAVASGTFKGTIFSLGDIAALGSRLIAAGVNGNSLTLYRMDNATGTPATNLEAVQKFSGQIGAEPLLDLEHLAIAAAGSTVAVVFAGKGTRGGWALFSCNG